MNNKLNFVNYKGRNIPTIDGLNFLGKATGDTIPPEIAKISDSNYAITEKQIYNIIWNLKKFTSITFISRLLEIISLFTEGYEEYLCKSIACQDEIDALRKLNIAIDRISKSIEIQKSNNSDTGYLLLLECSDFDSYFSGRMLYEIDHTNIGYRGLNNKPDGLFRYIQKASDIYALVINTITHNWVIPKRYENDPDLLLSSADNNLINLSNNLTFSTGDKVPFNGIWNPIGFKSGCPNYLLSGSNFPEIEIVDKSIIYPEYIEESNIYHPENISFDYKLYPSKWQLLWKDDRYKDGKIPDDEAQYLDNSVAIPQE